MKSLLPTFVFFFSFWTAWGQTMSSSPTVNTFTQCNTSGGNILGGCAVSGTNYWNSGVIKARLTNLTATQATFEMDKCSGTFSSNGSMYVKDGGVCGTSLASANYSSGSSSKSITISHGVTSGQSKTFYVTITSSTTDKYYAYPITVTSSSGGGGSSGCINTNLYPSTTLTPTTSWQTYTNLWAGDYTNYSVVNGQTYIFSTCSADGGSASYDTELTLTDASNTFIAFSDDDCGTGTASKITWTATYSGTVRLHLTEYQCLTNNTSTTVAYKKNGTGGGGGLVDVEPINSTVTPSNVAYGNTTVINTSVINNSTTTAVSGTVEIHYYWSPTTNPTDPNRIYLDDDLTISNLGPGATASELDIPTIASPIPCQNGYIIIIVDPNNQIAESNENNNTQVLSLTVTGCVTNTLNVTPPNLSFTATGSNKTFTISSNVAWTISSNVGWLTFSQTSNSGNATITVTCAANSGTSTRAGIITVSGTGVQSKQVSITQTGQSLSLDVSPPTLSFTATGSNKTFTISSNVAWTISSNVGWLTPSQTSNSGNATITVTCAANSGTSTRTGIITVSGAGVQSKQVSVTQTGQSLSLDVSPPTLSFTATGSNKTFTISSNVAWTISSNVGWLTPSQTSNSGNAIITVTCAANSGTSTRTGIITVLGTGVQSKQVSVTQTGQSLSLDVSPPTLSFTATGSNKTFTISSNVAWTISSNVGWLTPSQTSNSGNATITVTCAANSGTSTRTGIITVSGAGVQSKQVSVTQTGQTTSNQYTVTPGIGVFTGCGGNSAINATCCISSGTNITFIGDVIKAKVINITSNDITFRMEKCNGSFIQDGTLYVKQDNVCGFVLGHDTYNSGSIYKDITIPNDICDGTYTFYLTISPANTSVRYYAAPITISTTNPSQPFSLSPNISHIRWPFAASCWSNRNGWYGADEPQGTGNSHGNNCHIGSDYYAVDWNNMNYSDCDEPFLAPLSGTVINVYHSCSQNCSSSPNCQNSGGYGNTVVIHSANDPTYAFRVAHLNDVCVSLNQFVEVGTQIGKIGNTGSSYGSHAHCALYKNTNASLNGFSVSCTGASVPDNLAVPFLFDATSGGSSNGGGTTSTNQLRSKETAIKLYPNPVSKGDEVTIELNSLFLKENIKLSITNLTGQVIDLLSNEYINRNNSSINYNTGKLNAGIYFATLQTKNHKKTLKFIVTE